MTTDTEPEAALSRLTESEKQCLRRGLLPQSAKEMAISLGILAKWISDKDSDADGKVSQSEYLERSFAFSSNRRTSQLEAEILTSWAATFPILLPFPHPCAQAISGASAPAQSLEPQLGAAGL
jgi:hypothetical protein